MRRVRKIFLPSHSRLFLVLAVTAGLPLWGRGQSSVSSTSSQSGLPGVNIPSNSYATPTGFRGGLSPSRVRGSMTGWRAFRANTVDEDVSNATTKIGQVYLTLTAGLRVEYNDNVNISPNAPIGDFIITPEFHAAFYWPYSSRNSLSFNLGLKYDYYLTQTDLNEPNFSMDPGTIIEFRMFVGDFMFTLYDMPSIQNTPPPDLGVTNVVNFSQLQNTIGLSVLWDLNKVLLNARIERLDTVSLNNDFNSENSHGYTFGLEATYVYSPFLRFGVRGQINQTEYEEQVMNNYRSYEIGAFVEGRISNYTTFYLEAGLQRYEYSNTGTESSSGPVVVESAPAPAPTPVPVPGATPAPTPVPTSVPVDVPLSSPVVTNNNDNVTNVAETAGGGDFFGPYLRFNLFNRLNRYYDHSLILSVETQSSTISNYIQIFNVTYQFNWRLNREFSLFGTLGAEYGKYSGNDTGSYINLEAALAIQYRLFRDMFLRLEYRFFNKVGYENIEGYRQSRISLLMEYQF